MDSNAHISKNFAARLCYHSYSNNPDWPGHAGNPLTLVQTIETDTGIDAYVLKATNAEGFRFDILVIRGSDEKIDWENNYNLAGEKVYDSSCHEGFTNLTRELMSRLRYSIDFVTGHSLGGAMAELFVAMNIVRHGGVAFGSPGVRRCWSEKLPPTRNFFRYILDGDVVGRIPLTFVSDAQTFVYRKGEWIPYKKAKGYWKKAFNLVKGKEAMFKHHSINRYVEATQ